MKMFMVVGRVYFNRLNYMNGLTFKIILTSKATHLVNK